MKSSAMELVPFIKKWIQPASNANFVDAGLYTVRKMDNRIDLEMCRSNLNFQRNPQIKAFSPPQLLKCFFFFV